MMAMMIMLFRLDLLVNDFLVTFLKKGLIDSAVFMVKTIGRLLGFIDFRAS